MPKVPTIPEPLHRLQVSGLVPGGTPAPPKNQEDQLRPI